MTRTRISACIFVVASSLAACTGTGEVEYAGEVHVASPDLIEVSPGVQVIADADEPIFYANNNYWLYRDGYWFRSDDFRRGYVRVSFTYVPQQVRVIQRPEGYVHYRSRMGRDRAARTPDMRTRSQPTYQQPVQPQAQPTYPPPVPSQPGYPTQTQPPATSPTSPVYQPNQPQLPGAQPPGVNPTQPTSPPSPTEPTRTPNDNRREPPGQRTVPPDIDHTVPTPPADGTAPVDRGNRPDNSGKPTPTPPGQNVRPDDRGKATAPGQDPDRDKHEHANPSDRSDRGTPPANNNADDRTKKHDEKKDKKDKRDK